MAAAGRLDCHYCCGVAMLSYLASNAHLILPLLIPGLSVCHLAWHGGLGGLETIALAV